MAAAEPAIELIDADIPRARTVAPSPLLFGVNWRIGSGEFWALGAGPGRGKTDLLCTAAALQRPLNGYHLLFGRDTRLMNEQELVISHKKVGMVFENGRLFPNLTVAENLALPLAYHLGSHHREVAERVSRVIEALKLEVVRDLRPSEIMRSLHQRAGLARALVLEPEVLLIDNPMGAIDPRQGRWWLDFLCELNEGHEICGKRPLTVVVSADNFLPWEDVARQFAVIENQAVQQVGGREAMRESRNSTVQELLMPAFDSD